jgi:ABC-type sugar transport system ATPase subunit
MTTATAEHVGPALLGRGLAKRYGGITALGGVDFELRSGELAAIVGDNGAGKSTLVKILSGAIQPDEGTITLGGEERSFRSPMDAKRAGIETVYQDLALIDEMNVVRNIFLAREKTWFRAGWLSIVNRRAMEASAREMLKRTGVQIPDVRQSLRHLSGGQRQGVAIARAAGWGSRVIIMDEPTAALGVQETHRVEEIIRSLKAQGISLILVSHSIQQVFALADRIWVLRRGSLAGVLSRESCTPDDVVRLITGADQALATDYL